MKLESLFEIKENKLFKISDGTEVNCSNLFVYEADQKNIEIDEDIYNEEFLADLREKLKGLDEEGKFAFIKIKSDAILDSEDKIESYINTFNHTARRIKDCVSVTGFLLSENILACGKGAVEEFIEVLAKKHAQYVYFASKELCEKYKLLELPLVHI